MHQEHDHRRDDHDEQHDGVENVRLRRFIAHAGRVHDLLHARRAAPIRRVVTKPRPPVSKQGMDKVTPTIDLTERARAAALGDRDAARQVLDGLIESGAARGKIVVRAPS